MALAALLPTESINCGGGEKNIHSIRNICLCSQLSVDIQNAVLGAQC